jgi:DNA-binding response OmpR family regulator
MSEGQKKILIVEDDLISAEYLKELLTKEKYHIGEIVDNAIDAQKEANIFKPDLILMDIVLKGAISGSEAAIKIHQNNPNIKIIFLTAHSEKEMIDYAIDAKAMAYLLKPYRDNEILATIKLLFAQSKNSKKVEAENIILKNGYSYNMKVHRLFKNNQEVLLGKKTLKLIEILVKNKNISVSNEQICTYIWGEQKNGKTLRSLIHRVRSTIDPNLIENINGLGYKIT